ncbi:hypothetical protein CEXT_506501 [Caerostris extrusa]|uniref:Uncharacterized protein n=1 Tax=Caerostris extrusa TaxID=172846 RepID=A0AAV4QSS4_CAEEX|nr:hypothetical protein CEXT_506501 [Caerostris extrusa]
MHAEILPRPIFENHQRLNNNPDTNSPFSRGKTLKGRMVAASLSIKIFLEQLPGLLQLSRKASPGKRDFPEDQAISGSCRNLNILKTLLRNALLFLALSLTIL